MFDWIIGLLDAAGYLGVAFLMFAENVFPPIPSELIMPLAGFLAYQDQMNFVGVVIAGSIGSLAGTYLYYIIARKIGHDRVRHLLEKHGRWLTMSPRILTARRTGSTATAIWPCSWGAWCPRSAH